MNETKRYERLIRWYPSNWRRRYGDGFAALLEDTYGANAPSWRARVSIARTGLAERAREAGLIGGATSSNDRLRAGSQLVLCGWSLFMVAGAIFAKFTEHWDTATPIAHRTLPNVSDSAVQWAGGAGMALVLLAGFFAVPATIRLLRDGGWTSIRRPMLQSVVAILVATVLTAAVAMRAHHLNYLQRNGGSVAYEVIFLLCCLAIVAALVTVTSSVISVTRQLNFSRSALLILSTLALVITLLMSVITAGTIAWWANEATYAPQFLHNSIGSGLWLTSNSLPPALLVSGALMILGLVTALTGVRRALGGFRFDAALSRPPD